MEWNYERESEKRAELLNQLSQALRSCGIPDSDLTNLSNTILNTYVSTQPPEAPNARIELVTISRMGFGGGKTTKAGNVKLNIGKLFLALAGGVLTGVGAAQVPFTVPFAALVIWNSLWVTAQVTISETEAGVLYTMWLHKNLDRDVSEDGLLEKHNALLDKYGRPSVSQRMLQEALKSLERLDTIERSPRDPTMWWLREWVRVSYR